MDYFTSQMSIDEIKSKYRQLALANHPDKGGDTRTMQDINAAYAFAINHAVRREKPGKTEQEYAEINQKWRVGGLT